MKKLIIAMFAGVIGIAANAASVTWQADDGGILYPNGDMSGGEGYVTMYLWTIDATTYDTLYKGGDAGVSAAVWGAYGSKLATAESSQLDEEGITYLTSSKSYGTGDTAYAAVIFTYNEGEGVTHYKGNIGSYTLPSETDMTISQMDSVVLGSVSGSTSLGWTAVPEPTSGLLMLVGLAGLALRRRRA